MPERAGELRFDQPTYFRSEGIESTRSVAVGVATKCHLHAAIAAEGVDEDGEVRADDIGKEESFAAAIVESRVVLFRCIGGEAGCRRLADQVSDRRDLEHRADGTGDTLEFTSAIERGEEIAKGRIHWQEIRSLMTQPQEQGNSGELAEPKRASIDETYQRDWPKYFEAVSGKPPRDTVLFALQRFAEEGVKERWAIDIACGEGRDTRAILAAGPWTVLAVDGHAEAVERTKAQIPPQYRNRCIVRQAVMELLPPETEHAGMIDLVNASFALPFCDPQGFPALWEWIKHMLKPGGRFAGQFFGERDDWYNIRPGSHMTQDQLIDLFDGFVIEHFDEVEKDGADAMGGMKHHHVFHVVARLSGAQAPKT